jgi:integrase
MTHATTIRDKAIIAALRDTGFRASELLALNTDSIAFDGRGGARITLPASAPALKTGPRSVYVIRAAPILRALVALRNIDTGSPAPLFASKSKRSLGQRLKAHNLPRLIRSLCEEAGIRALWPHLFRHTRVTEAARNHWNEAQMRLFFGWSRFSKMPSHYSHLSIEDLERTILQEAKRPAITHLDEAAALLPVFMKFLGAIEGRNVLPRGLRPLPSRATTA